MTRTESIFLRKILPSYFQYVSQQPDTLLPKFYGMHRVKRKKQKIYFLIQQNVFFSDVDDIHDQYDLKGSTQGRRATKAEREKGAILKDLDWVDGGNKIRIGSSRAKLFKDQLKRDCQWLRTEKIMDYSLLVGVHYLDRAKSKSPKQRATDNRTVHLVLDHSNPAHYEPALNAVSEEKVDALSVPPSERPVMESKEVTPFVSIVTDREKPSIGISPSESTTEQTGDDEEDLDVPLSIVPSLESVRSHSVDIGQSASDPEYRSSKRRSSAPIIVGLTETERETQSENVVAADHQVPRLKLRGSHSHHISVNHPKRYRRKTAAQMQFAVEDIQIPKGLQPDLEANTETQTESETVHSPLSLEDLQSPDTAQIVLGTMPSPTEQTTHRLEVPTASAQQLESMGSAVEVCPWTTYRGGMVLEDDEGHCVGNEVYFVGLIDILQKYNKRKKLENWIKSAKYDKKSISAVPPDLYAQRMHDFFEDKVV